MDEKVRDTIARTFCQRFHWIARAVKRGPDGEGDDALRACDSCTHTATEALAKVSVPSKHIDLAVDRNGQHYTTHVFAQDGDRRRGALILTESEIRRLGRDGLLPLKIVEDDDG